MPLQRLVTAALPRSMDKAGVAKLFSAKAADHLDQAEIIEPLGRAIAVGAAVMMVAIIAVLMSMV